MRQKEQKITTEQLLKLIQQGQEEIEDKPIPQIVKPTKVKVVDPSKKGSPYPMPSWWKRKFIKLFKKKSTYLINMQLDSGSWTSFLASPTGDNTIHYMGRDYVIDDNCLKYHHGIKKYCLFYHQSFNLPFNIWFPLRETETAMQNLQTEGIEYHTNPSTLKTYLQNNLVQSAIKAGSLMDIMKKVMVISLIGAAASIILLLVYLNESGVFSRLAG